MGNSWIKALFADLAPKSDKDSGYSSASFEDSKRDRWNRQRPQSSQPKPVTQDSHEYDLVAHARSSLQIADSGPHDDRALNSTSAARSHRHGPLGTGPNSQWQHTSESAQAPSPGHNGPSDLAGRRINNSTAPIPPPVGPRPILFPQEMPKLETGVDSTQADRKPISGDYLIGFVNPQQTPPRHRQEKSKPHLNFRHTASSSPQRYNGQASTSGSLPRPQHLSTPERPVFLTTLPPDTPHRPHSDPQSLGKVVKTPVVSRSNSDDSGKCKPNQCYGTTAAGKRCTRTVKSRVVTSVPSGKIAQPADVRLSRNALKQLDRRLSIRKKPAGPTKRMMDRRQRVFESGSDSEEDFDVTAARLAPIQGDLVTEEESLEELPVFCYQHVKQTLEQRGTFINTKYVDFQDWIPAYLPQETQLQLRHEMAKPNTAMRPGYIYVHEFPLTRGTSDETTFIKLGRSVRPIARLSEWRSQCKSRQPIVRDIFPLHESHPLHPGHNASSLINTYRASPGHQHGRLLFAGKGVSAHQRWERLCLIELAGIAAFQEKDRQDSNISRQACIDCGKIHVELFLVNKGSYEEDIRDMVLRWQRFVETIL